MNENKDNAVFDVSNLGAFFDFTGGSLFYCLSAFFIILGIGRIMGPMLTNHELFKEALPCIFTLNLYEIALLGVLTTIVVWKSVTDDAISLVIFIAIFFVGTGLALSSIVFSNSWACPSMSEYT